jgi:hypothetical protein
MDGETFIIAFLLAGAAEVIIILVSLNSVQKLVPSSKSKDSEDEGISFSNSNTMLKVCRQ